MPPGSVVVVGEALVDLVVAADGSARVHPGGGPFTAARALARLGSEVLFLGRLSGDRFGSELRSQLHADGVRLADLPASPLPTTMAVAELDPDGSAAYRFYLTGTSAGDLTFGQLRDALPAEPAVVHVGTLGLVLEPLASALERLLPTLAGQVVVFCDPNCRATAIGTRAAYLRRLRQVLERTNVVKVSGDDLEFIDPGRGRLDAARALLDAGPAVVLLTDGGDAVHVLTVGAEREIAVPVVPVADTIGAGDAFGAGFVHRWDAAGHGLAQLSDIDVVAAAAAYGSRVAALTCMRHGADPPTSAEVELAGRTW